MDLKEFGGVGDYQPEAVDQVPFRQLFAFSGVEKRETSGEMYPGLYSSAIFYELRARRQAVVKIQQSESKPVRTVIFLPQDENRTVSTVMNDMIAAVFFMESPPVVFLLYKHMKNRAAEC